MVEIMPLQQQRWCPECNQPRACARVWQGDNRTHLTCLHCGFAYILNYGDEDDRDILYVGPYKARLMQPDPGEHPICELLE